MPDLAEPPDRPAPPAPREAVQRWRLVVARGSLEGDAGQREQLAAWEQAVARSGLPVAGLDADPPKPRLSTAAPLSASFPGEGELVDIWLTERLPVWRVREALARSLPAGHSLVDAFDVWLGAPALPGQVVASVYRATLAPGSIDVQVLEQACEALMRAGTIPRERRKGQGTITYDLRPFVEELGVDPSGPHLRMTLRHDPERGIGRPEEVLAELAERLQATLAPASLVRESLVLAPPPVPPAPARGPRPKPGQRAAPRSRPRP